ncbi:hypothetical protein BC937DRAFT_93254 [Endogone sp. FLAS-F59071]|nr:hypothetical protein BC937DRAFT_93254 [Endogone sp. FLAS-F59071]|eukprot:RUS14830.1 hypothetical protein BC937DRAFT_93254 [Endogone sp. FLAS-F59071]
MIHLVVNTYPELTKNSVYTESPLKAPDAWSVVFFEHNNTIISDSRSIPSMTTYRKRLDGTIETQHHYPSISGVFNGRWSNESDARLGLFVMAFNLSTTHRISARIEIYPSWKNMSSPYITPNIYDGFVVTEKPDDDPFLHKNPRGYTIWARAYTVHTSILSYIGISPSSDEPPNTNPDTLLESFPHHNSSPFRT